MEQKFTLRQWLEAYNRGEFENPDCETQCKAGWYDWFCRQSSLAAKTKKLAPKVKLIARSPKINIDKTYIFFKNNCPCDGSLYDDFRICDIETRDVIFTIIPACGHTNTKRQAQVWGKQNNFNEPLAAGSWDDVLAFFF